MYFISLKLPKMEAALLLKIHLRILKEWKGGIKDRFKFKGK